MYRIGEFSKITNLTVKTLRYYEEQGILIPSARAENDYRMYNNKDYERAQLINTLRKFDFSIAEMKDTLKNCENSEDLSYYLQEKKSLIKQNILKQKSLMKEIDHYLSPKSKEVNSMNQGSSQVDNENTQTTGIGSKYTFEIKDIAPVKVASIRYQGSYQEVGKYIGTIYKAVKDKADGAPFNCYYDNEYKEIADIELCVPTKVLVSGNNITAKQLPRIKALCTTHIGGYDTLNVAYKAIFDYIRENNISYMLPVREIYRKGPGMILKGNPDHYVTEILVPIEA
ncbi:MerR family transcriptional regulator [Anaeromicropila herbilytica]|uniref:MerR family transcriptional regulator n=1 Tax=Anaeromicropila herbilytica TaxID=2785025 RepID=A0A7R7END9_9FIRM|nr:MerR family transcriptional regulator [Anaeromicropila herbilytica]BCN31760.1 MerR family transcriptional regulator [Anaeromicropila herbilytica]